MIGVFALVSILYQGRYRSSREQERSTPSSTLNRGRIISVALERRASCALSGIVLVPVSWGIMFSMTGPTKEL